MPPSQEIEASRFSEDLIDFFRLLGKHRVEYVLVGGEAVIFHGYPRFTGDIDFLYSLAPANAERLFECLLEFWDGSIPGVSGSAELLEAGTIIQFGRPPHRIDLLNQIDGVSFAETWRNRIQVRITGSGAPIQTNYIGLAELLRNKRASGRPKDLDDLENLS